MSCEHLHGAPEGRWSATFEAKISACGKTCTSCEEALIAQKFLLQLAGLDDSQPLAAADQWLLLRWRLNKEHRRHALRPLSWTRNGVLVLTGAVALWVAPSWRGLMGLSTSWARVEAPWSLPLDLMLSARGLLGLALLVMAVVFWHEGERWIES